MIKKILILIFTIIPIISFSQTKVMFLDFGGVNTQHDTDVYHAFLIGYGNEFNPNNAFHMQSSPNQTAFDSAKAKNCKLMIRSSTGASGYLPTAHNNYPDVMLFMPAGSNSHILAYNDSIKWIVITGAGDTANFTGYKVEFWDTDPIYGNLSSFSNGYIAGKIAKIMDSLNCGIWEARYRARRQTGNIISDKNGYGKINMELAINYNGIIPPDYNIAIDSTFNKPKNLKIEWITNDSLKITFDRVNRGIMYYIYKNNALIDSTADSVKIIYCPKLTNSDYIIKYKVKLENGIFTDFSDSFILFLRKHGMM